MLLDRLGLANRLTSRFRRALDGLLLETQAKRFPAAVDLLVGDFGNLRRRFYLRKIGEVRQDAGGVRESDELLLDASLFGFVE